MWFGCWFVLGVIAVWLLVHVVVILVWSLVHSGGFMVDMVVWLWVRPGGDCGLVVALCGGDPGLVAGLS